MAYEVQEDWEREYLRAALPDRRLELIAEPLSIANADLARDAETVSVFIRSRVDAVALDRWRAVRHVSTRSTGVDHVDLRACEARGVTVTNVPRYGENTIAEHTFGLILALSRKILVAARRTRELDFDLEGLEGTDLRGKTLGVVGAGSIGLHVIRIARAFDMSVIAADTRPHSILAEVMGFRYAALDELLAASDIVSLHVPLVPATRQMMDRERFGRMKRGALFINTARGALVDTDALLWALDEGIVAAAGLDVVEGEETLREELQMFRGPGAEPHMRAVLSRHRVLLRDDVIVTPHVAWFSREARRRILATTVENIEAAARGRPINVVVPSGAGASRASLERP